MYDLIIIGGGPSAINCGLILGSAHKKPYVANKKIGIIANQLTSDMQAGTYNNFYGVSYGTSGKDLLKSSLEQLNKFSNIEQLTPDLVSAIVKNAEGFEIKTKNDTYQAKQVVVAIGHNPKVRKIEGLEPYLAQHEKSLEGQDKVALKNNDLKVTEGMYVAGVLSGCASQAVIAAGTGADVGVKILTDWNDGVFDHHHDKPE